MRRRLTITVADEVYQGLHDKIGRGRISRFVEELVRPYLVEPVDLEDQYRAAAAEEAAAEGDELWPWIEGPQSGSGDSR
jgi:predicted CopG family antitoxin